MEQHDINRAVESMLLTTTGLNAAQGALVDAMLVTLHELLPGFTGSLIQHFEAIQPSAAQHLDPEALKAFYQRADILRHNLDALQRAPRQG